MSIQWFPGHMTRTKKLIRENLKKVDMVIEILDARAPLASRNPLLGELTQGKPRLILLNKADLADPVVTDAWIRKLSEGNSIKAIAVNSRNKRSLKSIPKECKGLCKGKKWVNRRPVRAMIVGIPNVGKSTVINTLAGKKKAAAANKPGVTKDMQRVPISQEIQILDTPGILWHKFDDQLVGLKLATLGSIKDAVLLIDEIAVSALRYLNSIYPEIVSSRFKLVDDKGEKMSNGDLQVSDAHIILEQIARNRGLLVSGGEADKERAARLLIKELRDGIIGRISLEDSKDPSRGWEFTREEQ
ncbi:MULTISPECIES: ribosome biogenesis GTPase YlqF [unclassified Oceanispirochaeta]|uniref:ribosome biogenesis GTPase YlqF n=1 Tax=unclassified Oceanispirochaeta TaxID=2635722 RepID=UPI000E0965A2|nr:MULTISPECIES: ribosome biogenesis GTPase YlqF [unclassified Oceanispirochaeta]MBF9014746.1 ribosome biogenesis GTPase YlqF [Oceanispirochaeta sp. M2]NPD71002.1 ribosome biogenesis GTPase YlqF [Oceanispirochaeta sp. M1]RDG33835.1 ribosome biogenesis GTPase YlqF [Oceanispirochaeta sp. M1]